MASALRRLGEHEIETRLASMPAWRVVDGKLRREFRFADFVESFGFMARAALVAERMGHHPEWCNVYNRVVVDLSTHDVGGISERDFALAAALDRLAPP